MRTIAPGVHVLEAPQSFMGLELGSRMSAIAVDNGVVLYSPVAAPLETVTGVGTPRGVIAPNLFHHLHVGPWLEHGIPGWCAPGLPEKRPELSFAGVVEQEMEPFGPDLLLVPLSCFSLTNEVVALHRPTRTLFVTDLVMNFGPDAPWLTRAAMFSAWAYPGCRTSVLERVGMDRPKARKDIARLLQLDWDRLVPCHGHVIESGGHAALEKAFAWLN